MLFFPDLEIAQSSINFRWRFRQRPRQQESNQRTPTLDEPLCQDAEGISPPPKLLMPMRQVAKPSAPTLTHLGRQELRRCQCTAKLLLDFEFALGIAHCGVPLTAPIIQVGRFRGRENAVALCTDCID